MVNDKNMKRIQHRTGNYQNFPRTDIIYGTAEKILPPRARKTAIRSAVVVLRLKKIPITGTITIYNAVRNPVLPAEIYLRPHC